MILVGALVSAVVIHAQRKFVEDFRSRRDQHRRSPLSRTTWILDDEVELSLWRMDHCRDILSSLAAPFVLQWTLGHLMVVVVICALVLGLSRLSMATVIVLALVTGLILGPLLLARRGFRLMDIATLMAVVLLTIGFLLPAMVQTRSAPPARGLSRSRFRPVFTHCSLTIAKSFHSVLGWTNGGQECTLSRARNTSRFLDALACCPACADHVGATGECVL